MAVAKRRQRENRECDWASKFWHLEGWRFNSSGKQHKSNRHGKKWFASAGAKSTLYFTLWLFSQLGRACCFLPRQVWQALYVYLLEYQSGKRVSHKRVLELSYEDVKSAKNGLIVITPDFDNFTAKLIAADEYSKYMTETPILEGVANREYYGRSATSIENKSTIEYGTEQGLAALIYGEQGVSSLPI